MIPSPWHKVHVSRRTALTASVQIVAAVALSACGAAAAVTTSTQSSVQPSTTSAAATTAAPATTTAASSSVATSAATSTAAVSASSSVSSAAKATTTSATTASKAASASAALPTVNPNALQVWQPGWSATSDIVKGYQQSLNALAAKNSKLTAQVSLGTPFPDKFLTAAAAGTPPDLVFIPPEGGWPQDWANKQIVKNLDSYMQRDKLSVNDFFAPAWQGSLFQGHQYVMPIEVDPNFPLIYNKSLLQQVGMSAPPATIAELDDANQKLYQKQGNAVSRLGIFPPWMTYGSGNALLTYFAVFGGGYFAPGSTDQSKLEMTQPGNVAALGWMKKYADQFGGYTAIQAFAKTWGKDGYVDGVGHGFLAMGPMVSANYTSAVKAAKGSAYADAFAAAQMPVAQGVKADPGWLGGWAMGIPNGAKRADDSWTALSWLGGSPEGTDTWAAINGFLPGYKKSPYFTKMANDPVVSVYIKVLQDSYVVAPSPLGWHNIPAKASDTLLLDTVQGKTDINTALQQFQQVAQAALDKAKSS